MADSRIRIRVGDCEIEYEGDDGFAREGVLALLKEAMLVAPPKLRQKTAIGGAADQAASFQSKPSSGLTISTIAAHLNPDGTQDLAMCALAKLQLIDGKQHADKTEIWETMRGATGYFKSSMAKNFPRDLGRMVRGKKINEVGAHVYALTAGSAKDLEAKIADIG